MITLCGGWRDKDGQWVHRMPKILLPEDGKGGGVSHGICAECRDAFIERANLVHQAKEAAK